MEKLSPSDILLVINEVKTVKEKDALIKQLHKQLEKAHSLLREIPKFYPEFKPFCDELWDAIFKEERC